MERNICIINQTHTIAKKTKKFKNIMTQKSHEKNLNTCTFPMEMNTCTKKNTKKKSKKFTDDTNNKN
jgi:hypothetical protein